MTPPAEPRIFEIFASYSHKDAKFVKPMVQYLRPTGASVFRDRDNIQPGKKWSAVISNAIESCRLMYVFWCSHSATSREVQKEYEKAIQLDKEILPVLLDDTPLPAPLAEYQWVDLRVVIGKHQVTVEEVVTEKTKSTRGRSSGGSGRPGGGRAPVEEAFDSRDWQMEERRTTRKITRDKTPSADAIRKSAVLLSEKLEHRMKIK